MTGNRDSLDNRLASGYPVEVLLLPPAFRKPRKVPSCADTLSRAIC
jgi:hypothetical protein